MAVPRQIVSPPTIEPGPYGLLSVVQFPATTDGHWQNGITWQSACVTGLGGTSYDDCLSIEVTGGGVAPAETDKLPTMVRSVRAAQPFVCYAEFDCSPVGNDTAQQLASDAIAAAGPWQAERAFWTGVVQTGPGQTPVANVFPHLAANTGKVSAQDGAVLQTVPVTGGSATTDIVEALGFLEKQIGNCSNGTGVIHVPAEALATLDAWGLVKVNGGVLRTLNGNKVAAGAGYPGTAPSGAAPAAGTTWMYATGPVFGYASGVSIVGNQRQSLDRARNILKMIAERTYVLAWDCCYAGVLVKLGVPYSGTDAG